MRWFKHDSDASDDIKIKRLEEEFKNDGYSIFFKSIEIVAKEGSKGRISFEKYPKKWFSGRCHVSEEKIQDVFSRMADIGLINRKSFNGGVLHFSKFNKRADNYSKYIKRDYKVDSKQLSQEEKRIEEKRKEENREALQLFSDLHKEVVGVAYSPSFGKDKKLLYDLMEIYDDKTLEALTRGFFDGAKDPKEWWFDKQLSVGMLKALIPQIINRIRKKKDVDTNSNK